METPDCMTVAGLKARLMTRGDDWPVLLAEATQA